MAKEVEIIKLDAVQRGELGSRAANRLRRDGWLPAVVYDSGGKSRPVKFNRHAFELMVRRHGGQNLIIDLQTDSADPVKALLKDVQRDSISDHMLHVDLMEISMTRKLRLEVGIHLVGESPGVTVEGGIMEQLLREVMIECLPSDIVQELTVDVSRMNLGDSVFVRDLKKPDNITVLTPAHIAVASVHAPAVEEEVKPAEGEVEGAEAPAEGAPAEGGEQAEGGTEAKGEAEAKGGKGGKEAKPQEKDKKEKK